MHTMKNYAVSMSKVALSIFAYAVALAAGLVISGWLGMYVLEYLTSSQM